MPESDSLGQEILPTVLALGLGFPTVFFAIIFATGDSDTIASWLFLGLFAIMGTVLAYGIALLFRSSTRRRGIGIVAGVSAGVVIGAIGVYVLILLVMNAIGYS